MLLGETSDAEQCILSSRFGGVLRFRLTVGWRCITLGGSTGARAKVDSEARRFSRHVDPDGAATYALA
jgi:hypothetical protein